MSSCEKIFKKAKENTLKKMGLTEKTLNVVRARLMKTMFDETVKALDVECGLKKKLVKLISELKHATPEKPFYSYQEGWLDAMSLTVEKLEKLLKESRVVSR